MSSEEKKTQTEINNFRDLRFAYLHSKFGTHNSLQVPNQKVILNEDFVEFHNVVRIPEQIKHLNIYWINKGIAGEICVPGQWNYAYVDGKFYHMVKMHSQGFIEGVEEEGHMYNLIYDDWQNDWMNNTFYLKGTIELTGDPELVRENIHQTSPMLENVNGFRFLNGVRKNAENDYETIIKYPLLIPNNMRLIGMSSHDKININNELKYFKEHGNPKPNEEKLLIPFLYKVGIPGNGKGGIINGLKRLQKSGFKVYDVTTAIGGENEHDFRNILENFLGTNELYTVSNRENRVFTFASALNPTKGVSEIDLSQCTDIIVYDRLRLVPLYGVENRLPTFKVEDFIDAVINKQGGPNSYKDDLIVAFEESVIPLLAPLLSYDDEIEKKVFRNVTLEKIDRDIIDIKDPRGSTKNPEGLQWDETRLVGARHHKNNMGDNTDGSVSFICSSKYNLSERNPEEINKGSETYRKVIDTGSNLVVIDQFMERYGKRISRLNSFVYLPDEYKMVAEEGDNDELDFSRNLNELYNWFALIPDYDRKTHTLGYKYNYKYKEYISKVLPIFDPNNALNSKRKIDGVNIPILPVIFDEILQEDEEIIPLKGDNPTTELLKIYYNLGKDYKHPEGDTKEFFENRERQSTYRAGGAKGLIRGHAFGLISNTAWTAYGVGGANAAYYRLQHKNGNAICSGNYCRIREGYSGSIKSAYSADVSSVTYPECVYEDEKREWRRFHTEMTFPVKMDDVSIIDLLREYDDIPDNFIRGEIINSGISKGKIKKTVRTIQKTGSGRLNATTLSTEDEKKVPKNTLVSIGICNRPSGSPEGDRDFDKQAIDKYKQDHPDKDLRKRIGELKKKLYVQFFVNIGEKNGYPGAIPCRMRNESNVNPRIYPKSGGQSQMSLSWAKPHKGGGYVAGTRFIPPAMHNGFRFSDDGFLNFDKQGTEDGITSVIPNKYQGSSDYVPRFTFRDKATSSLSTNAQLAFMTGSIINHNIDYPDDFKVRDYQYYNDDELYNQPNILVGGNENKSVHGKPADYLHERFQKHFYNGNTLLLNDFFNNARTYKTNRLSNPEKIPSRGKSSNSADEKPEISKPKGKRDINKRTRREQPESILLPGGLDNRDLSVKDILFQTDPIGQTGQFLKGLNKQAESTVITSTKPKPQPEPEPPVIKKGYFTPFNEEVPPFIIKYFDLTDVECPLHHGDKNTSITSKEERILLFKEKMVLLCRFIIQTLENGNTFIKFEGTNGYASIKLNTKGNRPQGDYELFTNERSTFKNKETEKWNIINHIENDLDVLINTRNELSIHGNKIPLKTRIETDDPEIDLGLHVKALDDITQTQAAVGYAITIENAQQDTIQTFIETPKELTKQSNFSPFEREELIRKIGLRGEQYLYDKQMIEYQKVENKFTDQYERDYNNLQRKYGIARGVMKMIGGAADMAIGGIGSAVATSAINGVNPMGDSGVLNRRPGGNYGFDYEMYEFSPQERFTHSFHRPSAEYINFYKGRGRPPNRRAQFIHTGTPGAIDNRRMAHYALSQGGNATHGLGGIIDGALSIGEAIEGHTIREEYRKQKFDLAEKKLSAQGDILNRNYEFDRKNLLDDLWAMSANVVFPQINANIVYKLYNKHFGLNDIHMIQYYPKGKLLQYIKNYYREFGYNILVRDFECTGVESIINHLRYQYIKEINHPNISITEMIQARALAGIKVIPWTQ